MKLKRISSKSVTLHPRMKKNLQTTFLVSGRGSISIFSKFKKWTNKGRLKFITFSKREKIIAASAILSLGLLLSTQYVPFYLTGRYIAGLVLLTYFLSLWALWEGIDKTKAFVLFILPVMFVAAVASFYFLLPIRWLTRIPMAIIFGLSFYGLLLSQNVFNVASERTIPLYRAASTVGFLFTLITAYLINNVIFSLELSFLFNFLAIFATSFLLMLQIFWSISMEKITAIILVYSLAVALILGQVALALSFWPIVPTLASMVVSSAMYVMVGIAVQSFREKLTREAVLEYLGVGVVVFLVAYFSTSWIG